jgi:hypothetical protein
MKSLKNIKLINGLEKMPAANSSYKKLLSLGFIRNGNCSIKVLSIFVIASE